MKWSAKMIGPLAEHDAAPVLTQRFTLPSGHGRAVEAILSITGYGVVEAALNGQEVSDEVLAPGWSSYQYRLRVARHDVTTLLREENELAVLVGNGWYRGRLTWTGQRALYGPDRGAAAELLITFDDGYQQIVQTDETWRSHPSEVLEDDLYDGQVVDARQGRWTTAGSRSDGGLVRVLPVQDGLLTESETPPIRRQEELRVQSVLLEQDGRVIVDFGQNIVGWLHLHVQGRAGTTVRIRHAEVLDDGELALRPLRSAKATDEFILSGHFDDFEPTMTLHGFRYAEITGWPGAFDTDAVRAVVVHSEMRRIGRFACSDPVIGKLHENVVWGLRGNFVGLPTDCPQRDERLGWTGDIAVFTPTAAFLYDVGAMLNDWLVDLGLEQAHNDGIVPSVVPDVLRDVSMPFAEEIGVTAIWSDAAVWVPYGLWQAYGDTSVLTKHWDSMTSHVRVVADALSPSGLWDTGFQYGDWLDPTASPHEPWAARADASVVATACAYRTARMASEVAEALGREYERDEFAALADRVKRAFNDAYVLCNGRIVSDAPTVYTLAIAFELLDDADLTAAGDRLSQLVAAAGYRVSTGFAGTPYILDALTQTGHLDDAYRLLTERQSPSWLYMVDMGATTMWERWDSLLPDGSVNPGEMTSFNHYALGSVADWIHRTVAGIAPLEPGYRKILVAPRPGGGINAAQAELMTPFGSAAVSWQINDARLAVQVTVPPGTSALCQLPGGADEVLGPGEHALAVDYAMSGSTAAAVSGTTDAETFVEPFKGTIS